MSDALLNLSDEEILNLDLDQFESGEAEGADEAPDAESAPDTVEPEISDDAGTSEDLADAELDVSDDSSNTDLDSAEEIEQDAFSDDADEDSSEEAEATQDEIDYKAEYERLLTPFKANGKEIKIDSVDEAIQLMQMGANYNKKMSALKPNLKMLKMLENNGLLDESKLSYLIDLDKKDPGAISKLIKESGIDPLDVDSEQTSYKPKSYTVNDKEIELDTVLEEIQDTPTYSKTIDVVSNKWDTASRKVLIEHPTIIKLINEHMQTGVYAQIEAVIEKERMLGRLQGVSDLEAYRQVGDQLFANAGSQSPQEPRPVKATPKPKKQADPKVTNRKRAAAPTKSSPAKNTVPEDFNPLSLSDAEFEKLVANKFL